MPANPTIGTRVATIANTQTDSAAVDLEGTLALCGLLMPGTFTGASVTFLVSDALAGTYVLLRKDGADLSVAVAASRYVVVDPADFAGVRYLKLRSVSAETGDRTITLFTRAL